MQQQEAILASEAGKMRGEAGGWIPVNELLDIKKP